MMEAILILMVVLVNPALVVITHLANAKVIEFELTPLSHINIIIVVSVGPLPRGTYTLGNMRTFKGMNYWLVTLIVY